MLGARLNLGLGRKNFHQLTLLPGRSDQFAAMGDVSLPLRLSYLISLKFMAHRTGQPYSPGESALQIVHSCAAYAL